MPRRAAKVDANQNEIVRAIRDAYGPHTVLDLSAVGGGCPDLLIGVRGKNLFAELKTATGKLTNDQIHFHDRWQGQLCVARSLDEVLRIIEMETI
ncbi:MAG: hypothetical protein KDE19_15300 [Caldilineaceae bacterium]|nr:hypothetical protein [Caldilineaceae bacterium]